MSSIVLYACFYSKHRSTIITSPIHVARVQQGSILRPLLFVLYINDIVNVSKDAALLIYWQNNNVFLNDTDINQLSVLANKALLDKSNWFKLNKLSVHVKKFNFILFTTRPIRVYVKISIDNFDLERVKKLNSWVYLSMKS